MKDFISLQNLTPELWAHLLRTTSEVKQHPGHFRQMLVGKSLVLVFEKPSLRTRLTFELGMKQLGGEAVYLDHHESRLGGRESLSDVARNLERWFDCIVARTFSHDVVVELARHASIPVINGLSDAEHPCQALADAFTLSEKWEEPKGKSVAYVGDGNNVCVSLIHAALLSGMSFVAVTPESHQPDDEAVKNLEKLPGFVPGCYRWTDSLKDLQGADIVYTDTWVSMGQEEETRDRVRLFQPYQVTPEVMELTGKESYFMHCLPAHRNQEVTDSVIDSDHSLVFEQAENRLHAQKALLLFLLCAKELDRYFHLEKFAAWRD